MTMMPMDKALENLDITGDQVDLVKAAFYRFANLALPLELHRYRAMDNLFVQKGKFPEGSTPFPDSERGQAMNRLLKVMLGLDADNTRSKFCAFPAGAVYAAGGLYPVTVNEDDWRQSLVWQVTKGDLFTGGTKGAIGGNMEARHKGEPLACLLDESGEEVKWTPDRERLIDHGMFHGWRLKDGRVEAFSLWCEAFVYLAKRGEMEAIAQKAFVKIAKQGDEEREVVAMNGYTPQQLIDMIRSEEINFPENWKALTSLMCTLPHAGYAVDAVEATMTFTSEQERQQTAWLTAKAMGQKTYQKIISSGADWHKQLTLEMFEVD